MGVHPSLQGLMIKFLIWGSFYVVAGGRSMMGMLVALLRDKCLCVLCIIYVAVSRCCNVFCVYVSRQTKIGIRDVRVFG